MGEAFHRPYEPIDPAAERVTPFRLDAMAQQLRAESTFQNGDRDALTLVHGDGLTAVLTVAKRGTVCDLHHQPGPSLIVDLSGSLTVHPEDSQPISLEAGVRGGDRRARRPSG